MTHEQWYPTTPRRPGNAITVALGVLAGLGCCGLLWVAVLIASFAIDPDRPSSPPETTRSTP